MSELEELRYLARLARSPMSSHNQRELGRWAISELKEKYPGKGIFKPKEGEE